MRIVYIYFALTYTLLHQNTKHSYISCILLELSMFIFIFYYTYIAQAGS